VTTTAEVAGKTAVGDPLDAHTIANFNELVGSITQCYNDACTLMSTDERHLGIDRPVTLSTKHQLKCSNFLNDGLLTRMAWRSVWQTYQK
jgi:hypothetical protein